MRHPILTVFTLFTLAGSGSFNVIAAACEPPSTPKQSGIEGQVFIGPVCPVVQAGINCADRPYQAAIAVLDEKGQIVTSLQTDAEGHFQVQLQPGRYTLRPESPGVLPYAAEQTIIVSDSQFTPVNITYDSGIR
ncbi:MAG: carboxypeptidase-like regulatory domain-containing protein [Aphanothece sp. CMT-3BRIN-NPC111]|jgi:hypothetical protein|nr:carboxypeptidase-like regulatory domain-containing protein [Aphanothece sp. CMT-3BRIN-NPC111]